MRIFTFGCSYTGYCWPTWADILLQSGVEGTNLGYTGIGNLAIANRVFHQLTRDHQPDDLYIVAWSTVNREDRSRDGVWRAGGNVYNNRHYDENFLVDYWDDTDALNKTLMLIYFVNEMVRGKVQFHQTSMFGADLMFDEYRNRRVFNYQPRLLEHAEQVMSQLDWLPPLHDEARKALLRNVRIPLTVQYADGSKPRVDHHPTPLMHLAWAQQNFPHLVTAEGIQLAEQYERLVQVELRDSSKVATVWGQDPRNRQKHQNAIWMEQE